ncbi:hypothetical protein JKP88DRAFT_337514, partial [Tribonema minus]
MLYEDIKGARHVVTLVDAAAAFDDASVLRWLHARQPLEFTDITMQLAARGGGLPTLKWLRSQGCPHDMNDIARVLLKSRHGAATPPKLAWVRSCGGCDWSARGMTDMLVAALAHGTPALARWLRVEGARWPADLTEVVKTNVKRIKTCNLLWAVQQGCPFGRWTSEVCEFALGHGVLSLVKWSIEHSARWGSRS